jgi:hypothetical protein
MANDDVNITIKHTKKREAISDFSQHDTKSKEGLSKLRVIDLRALVVKHNLHAMIRKYNVMKKSELIDVLLNNSPKKIVSAPPPPPPKSPVKPTGKALKPRAMKRKTRGVKPPVKPKGRGSKPKLTGFDKAMGIGKPLFSKEEGGFTEGARAQFEKKYGTTKDAEFLKKLGEKMGKERALGRGKRKKKVPAKLRN